MPGPYFLDTSAVAKRYVAERGSAWVTSLTELSSGNACWLAAVTRVELVAAFQLRVRTGTLTAAQARQAEQLFRTELQTHYRLRAISDTILDRAMRLVVTHPLRAYDAIQLASALELHARRRARGLSLPILVSADHTLNQAAAAEGLSVDDPNNHP
jgi:uncharacterized protein